MAKASTVLSPTGAAVDVVVTFAPDLQPLAEIAYYLVSFQWNNQGPFQVQVPGPWFNQPPQGQPGPVRSQYMAAYSQITPSLPALNNGDVVAFPGGIISVDNVGRTAGPTAIEPASITISVQNVQAPPPGGVPSASAQQVNVGSLPPPPPPPPPPNVSGI